jgi:hypothetical protein
VVCADRNPRALGREAEAGVADHFFSTVPNVAAPPQVLAIQFEEVEGVEEDMPTRRLAPQPFEYRGSVPIAGDCLAIDQAGTHLEVASGLGDERKAPGPVDAVPCQQPHANGVTSRHQPEAVVFDLVNPAGTARRVPAWGWEAGFDKARRQTGTRQHGKNKIPCCMYVAERKRHPL